MKNKLFILLILALSLTGCVSTSVTSLDNRRYPRIEPYQVVLYVDEADVPRKFEKVAILHSRADHSWTDESQMFKHARKKAAKLGANGLLVQRLKEPNTGDKVAQVLLGTTANRRGEMLAIYVHPEGASGSN